MNIRHESEGQRFDSRGFEPANISWSHFEKPPSDREFHLRQSDFVFVNASVNDATLARWEKAAREMCPFAFTVANAVPLETVVDRIR